MSRSRRLDALESKVEEASAALDALRRWARALAGSAIDLDAFGVGAFGTTPPSGPAPILTPACSDPIPFDVDLVDSDYGPITVSFDNYNPATGRWSWFGCKTISTSGGPVAMQWGLIVRNSPDVILQRVWNPTANPPCPSSGVLLGTGDGDFATWTCGPFAATMTTNRAHTAGTGATLTINTV